MFAQHSRKRGVRVRRGGFTLLEVLLVLAILVVLATLAVGVFGGAQQRANIDAAKHDVTEIANAMERFKFFNKQWPENFEALQDPPNGMDAVTWGGPYLKHTFVDPWGNPYIIGSVDQYDAKIEILSSGPDRSQGTEDDISSFK
jgi:general secretion pathway protein G